MSDLCQWEIDWIRSHPEMYEGPTHVKAAIRLVTNRYTLKRAQTTVDTALHNQTLSTNRVLAVAINSLMTLQQ